MRLDDYCVFEYMKFERKIKIKSKRQQRKEDGGRYRVYGVRCTLYNVSNYYDRISNS